LRSEAYDDAVMLGKEGILNAQLVIARRYLCLDQRQLTKGHNTDA